MMFESFASSNTIRRVCTTIFILPSPAIATSSCVGTADCSHVLEYAKWGSASTGSVYSPCRLVPFSFAVAETMLGKRPARGLQVRSPDRLSRLPQCCQWWLEVSPILLRSAEPRDGGIGSCYSDETI
ncbi:hypothetical protein F4819DRAFT_471134 [Hypoxylon fuscum]|nr:hypothetical protein F4819DRAFT_471134 [Hypoxylon fuscum]